MVKTTLSQFLTLYRYFPLWFSAAFRPRIEGEAIESLIAVRKVNLSWGDYPVEDEVLARPRVECGYGMRTRIDSTRSRLNELPQNTPYSRKLKVWYWYTLYSSDNYLYVFLVWKCELFWYYFPTNLLSGPERHDRGITKRPRVFDNPVCHFLQCYFTFGSFYAVEFPSEATHKVLQLA